MPWPNEHDPKHLILWALDIAPLPEKKGTVVEGLNFVEGAIFSSVDHMHGVITPLRIEDMISSVIGSSADGMQQQINEIRDRLAVIEATLRIM